MVDPSAFAGKVLDKQRVGWYVVKTYGRRTSCHICWESTRRRRQNLHHEGGMGTTDAGSILTQRPDISSVSRCEAQFAGSLRGNNSEDS